MWKTVVGLVVFLSLVDVARGKEFKGNLDPLKKLSVSQPECDLPSYFSSAEEFDSLKQDLKEFCPSALSKSKLSDEMKEKSLVLCQLLLVQLNRTCASGQDAKLSPIAYATPLDKVKVCQKKAVLSANNNLLPLINIPADNPLQIDAKNLCKQIIDDETTKLVRLIYRLHDLLSKINPKKDLPATNATSTTNNATSATNATAIIASANVTATNSSANATTTIIETKLANATKVLNETLTRNASVTAALPALNSTLLVGSTNLSNATTETIKLNSTTPIVTLNSTAAKTLDLKKEEKETKDTQQKPKTDENEDEDGDEDQENPKETENKPEPKPGVDQPPSKEEPKKPEEKTPTDEGDGPDGEETKKSEDGKKDAPAPDKSKEEKPKEEAEDQAEGTKDKDEKNAEDYGDGDNVVKEPAGDDDEPAANEDAELPKEGGRDEEIVETNQGIDDNVDQSNNAEPRVEPDPHQPYHHHLEETDDAENPSSRDKNRKHDEAKPLPKPPKASERKPSSYDADQGSSGSFVTYFLLFTLFIVIGYLILHNKNKLIGYLVEGRRTKTSRTGSRPSHRHYEPIQNVNDVIDLDQNNFSTNK